jgi:cell filamentation protein
VAVPEDPYVYPGTSVLRNRFGEPDAGELARREAAATTVRIAELTERPIPGDYDLSHLQAFQRHIFGDVYEWAGGIRTVAIAKGDLFALPEHIEPYLADVLCQLPAERHLRGLGRDAFLDRLTHYLAEINSVHPFREGNGRTQRAFLEQLASDAAYHIDWTRLDAARNIEACEAAHRGHEQPMREMLAELVVDRDQQQVGDLCSDAAPRPNRPTGGGPTPDRSPASKPQQRTSRRRGR